MRRWSCAAQLTGIHEGVFGCFKRRKHAARCGDIPVLRIGGVEVDVIHEGSFVVGAGGQRLSAAITTRTPPIASTAHSATGFRH